MHTDKTPLLIKEIDDLLDVEALADDYAYDEDREVRVDVLLEEELRGVRAIEPRTDPKAGGLLNLAAGLLVAGLTLLGTGKLPVPAAVAATVSVVLLVAAVAVLSASMRPDLGGGFGFPRWARARTDQEVLAVLATGPRLDSQARQLEQARQLRWLSRSLWRKFARMSTGQTLIVLALVAGTVAAVLSAIGR